MSVSGDFAKFEEIQRMLSRIAQGDLLRRVSKQVAVEAQNLIGEGFQKSVAPDGTPWAPLVVRDGQPLRDTGRLATSVAVVDTGSGFVASTSVAYAPVHQNGATIKAKGKRGLYSKKLKMAFGKEVTIPARPFLPQGSLPAPWAKRIGEVIEDAVEAFTEPAR